VANGVVVSNCHLAAASQMSKIMESSVNAHIRYGFTGTLQDAKCHQLVILGHFGAEKRVIETKELMDMGIITQLLVKCVIFKYPEEESVNLAKVINAKKRNGGNGYQTEIDYIISHKSRMNNLIGLILSLKNNSLVLFNFVDRHGKVLYNKMKEMNEKHKLGKTILYISGETEADIREETRGIMEVNDNVILVASYGTCATGMNIRNIHNVVSAAPYKSKIKILQAIGRGLRKNENKDGVVWYDVVDDLSYKTRKGNLKQNYALLHFAERFNIYKAEKFEFKVISKSI
jgi:superfamily II DNA or RNA helicase